MAGQQCGRILYEYEIMSRIIQPTLKGDERTVSLRRRASTIDHCRVMTSMHKVLRNDLADSDGSLSCDLHDDARRATRY